MRLNFGFWHLTKACLSSVTPPSQLTSMSSFSELMAELHTLSPENGSAPPRGSFRAVSRIMCGHPEEGGEQIPSLNWYEDNDIKSFLSKTSSEEATTQKHNTSKQDWFFIEKKFLTAFLQYNIKYKVMVYLTGFLITL